MGQFRSNILTNHCFINPPKKKQGVSLWKITDTISAFPVDLIKSVYKLIVYDGFHKGCLFASWISFLLSDLNQFFTFHLSSSSQSARWFGLFLLRIVTITEDAQQTKMKERKKIIKFTMQLLWISTRHTVYKSRRNNVITINWTEKEF